MKIVKISSKGPIIIPQKFLEKLDLETGDNVAFVFKGEKAIIKKVNFLKLL